MAEKSINVIGKKCPMPVLMTKKELRKMNTGDILKLIADDKGSLKDIPALLKKSGDELLETKELEKQIIFMIKKA